MIPPFEKRNERTRVHDPSQIVIYGMSSDRAPPGGQGSSPRTGVSHLPLII